MASKHLSIRMDPASLARLDAESRRMRLSRSETARTLLEEGLRMEAHPGIVFRDGPTGRRPALVNGPDVWEIARLFQDMKATGDSAVSRTAEWAALRPEQVQLALRYYADFTDEVDEWIRDVEQESERAYAEWLREQDSGPA